VKILEKDISGRAGLISKNYKLKDGFFKKSGMHCIPRTYIQFVHKNAMSDRIKHLFTNSVFFSTD